MKYAGTQAEKYCAKPDNAWAFLIFGDDAGVVDDAAINLRRALDSGQGNSEAITLDEDAIRREPTVLFDALEARSLLGEKQIIRIRISGEKISQLILEAIALGEADPKRFEARLIITAGALAKRSKLRATIETARAATALHFFADETRDVSALARTHLAGTRVEIEDTALALFAAELPGHRGMANQELAKLALYGHGLGRAISAKDIRALSTIDGNAALHELTSATLGGQMAKADALLDKLTISGTSPIAILRALQRETMRLIQAHTLSSAGGEIGMKLRPPVFKSAWPAFRQILSLWPPKRLARILERIYESEARIKKAGPTGGAIVRQLIAELSSVAARVA